MVTGQGKLSYRNNDVIEFQDVENVLLFYLFYWRNKSATYNLERMQDYSREVLNQIAYHKEKQSTTG